MMFSCYIGPLGYGSGGSRSSISSISCRGGVLLEQSHRRPGKAGGIHSSSSTWSTMANSHGTACTRSRRSTSSTTNHSRRGQHTGSIKTTSIRNNHRRRHYHNSHHHLHFHSSSSSSSSLRYRRPCRTPPPTLTLRLPRVQQEGREARATPRRFHRRVSPLCPMAAAAAAEHCRRGTRDRVWRRLRRS